MVLSRAPGLACWLVPVAEIAGVARHVLDVTAAGIPGWRVIVLCPEGPLAEELHARGVPVVTGEFSPADGARRAVPAVRRALRRLRPELLHTHLAYADLTGVAAVTGLRSGRGERMRLVSTEHGISGVRGLYQSSPASARARAAAHRARLQRTDRVLAVSASTREQIAAQWGNGAEITVLPNEVDVPAGAPAPRPGLRVLSLSRLAPEKRIDALLHAMVRVVQEHPEARLTLAGDGPEREKLLSLVRELRLEEHVDLPGFVDAREALASHDVVAQLSLWENLSYTLLDAVAHGLGVVATDVGGNREIVPTRCLVAAEDTGAVAAVILEQGLELASRPGAERAGAVESGSGTARMTARIAEAYEEVVA